MRRSLVLATPARVSARSALTRQTAFVRGVKPSAYILFGPTGGEFAFGCATGSLADVSKSDAAAFDWEGNDEMDEAHGEGWAELQDDGSLAGEINFDNCDDIPFIARPSPTSSTAC